MKEKPGGSTDDRRPPMTDKQAAFVGEYLVDSNATQAAIRAGYSGHTAYSQGQRLLKNVEVAGALDEAKARRAERTEVTQDWVIQRLVRNVEQAMQAVPVLDRAGNQTGWYVYQGAVANKALELLGKMVAPAADTSEEPLLRVVITRRIIDPDPE